MPINRANLATTAANADILTVGAGGSPLFNFGNLTTSGDFANPIAVTASGALVTNFGNLLTHGNGASAIIAGSGLQNASGPHVVAVDNATILNFGSITTTGGTFDDGTTLAFSAGIDMFGDHNKAINFGTITNLDGDNVGINSIGANSTIINYGTIESQLAGIAVDQFTGLEIHNVILNFGQIHTAWDGSTGIWLLTDDNVVKNYGKIQVDGVFSFGIDMGGSNNRGENYGTILATGDQGRGVLFENEHSTFLNRGLISTTGVDSVAVRFSGDNVLGSDGGTFTTTGKVQSAGWAVRGSDSNDHILNYGAMTGLVDLGAGDDLYVSGKGASLNGAINLGDGNDLVVVERGSGPLTINDFIAGAASGDVIDLRAFGYHSLGELMGDARQIGGDVLLDLAGRSDITLHGVTLASLTAGDFAFAVAGKSDADSHHQSAAAIQADYMFA